MDGLDDNCFENGKSGPCGCCVGKKSNFVHAAYPEKAHSTVVEASIVTQEEVCDRMAEFIEMNDTDQLFSMRTICCA